MPTVAEQLREAREAKELTVHQVAEITKIRSDHIRALDEGDYEIFPAPVYIRGFVRTYAGFLRLDVDSIIRQLNEELSRSEKHRDNPALAPTPKGFLDFLLPQLWRVNWKIVLPLLVLALVLVGGVYAYRAVLSSRPKDPLAELGPGLYEPRQRDTGELLPLPDPRKR